MLADLDILVKKMNFVSLPLGMAQHLIINYYEKKP